MELKTIVFGKILASPYFSPIFAPYIKKALIICYVHLALRNKLDVKSLLQNSIFGQLDSDCYEKLGQMGDISKFKSQIQNHSGIRELLAKYPDCKAARAARIWLSK